MTFKIVVVGGPAELYISKCLGSLNIQSDSNWEAQVILDPVGDRTAEIAKTLASDKIQVHVNQTRMYALANIVKAIELLKPKDNDVIVTVDADDWLFIKDALAIVRTAYENNPELLLTYGSWIAYVGYYDAKYKTNTEVGYTRENFIKLRKTGWKASHLRTFKYKLWKHINDTDLRDVLGRYYEVAWDLAFMWPMLEMAGYDRVKHIPDILYAYNVQTPYNDAKTRLIEQMLLTEMLARKTPYSFKSVL